ncbi:FtsW/RodA/SpoVE family cell cycle protein [Chloroflexota bacterium]
MGLYTVALTLAPAVRARSWDVFFRWDFWICYLIWLVFVNFTNIQSARRLPTRDPYIFPVAAFLSGLGLLTIWRLLPVFGTRQIIWYSIALLIYIGGLRLSPDLLFLRRYKYIWLTGSLLLAAATLIFGTNPLGYGPRMWLGCCGIYFQPSELLKLLLVVYLASYLADNQFLLTLTSSEEITNQSSNNSQQSTQSNTKPITNSSLNTSLLTLLAPTLVMVGLAMALLLVQRDLGTAFILLFLFAAMVYVASGRKRILLIAGGFALLAAIIGYFSFDVVRVRLAAWMNPWSDPSGSTYQIVQSLISLANGGLVGRGPGLGNPGLVPLAHSDFIFPAIAEENGLIGALGLLILFAILAARGISIAINARDAYHRYLAAGLTALLVGQSILIIAGNIRLLPLTGITLPFVSYGGSSLITSFLALLFLTQISVNIKASPGAISNPRPYLQLGAFLFFGLFAIALAVGWWTIIRSPDMLARTDNPRRSIADRVIRRGAILDRRNSPINATMGEPGEFYRQTMYPPLSNIIGYINPIYGLTGLEATLDDYLRGLKGNPTLSTWWNQLLYGQPPPGLDVRISIDLELQKKADQLLGDNKGALVLLNPESGEILAMSSKPTFDANILEEDWELLLQDQEKPLFNRATLGLYSPGASLGPMLMASVISQGSLPTLPAELTYTQGNQIVTCAIQPEDASWTETIAKGCPGATVSLEKHLGREESVELYKSLGLFSAPKLRLLTSHSTEIETAMDEPSIALGGYLKVSPLQMALASATLSSNGILPPPNITTAVDTPLADWVVLPPPGQPEQIFSGAPANKTALDLAVEGEPFWQSVTSTLSPDSETQSKSITWYTGGSLPGLEGTPVVLALLLESDDPMLALEIGRKILQAALQP